MAAALVTALARAALRATTGVPTELATPANVLRLTGRRLHQDVGRQHFVACALAVIEPPNAERRHPWLRLGVLADAVYKDTETTLQPGDVVVFSSDGLAEAPAQSKVTLPTDSPFPPPQQPGELFGFERLAQSVGYWATQGETAEAVAQGIWSDLSAWCGEESHHDDMTLLVLRVPKA